MPICLVYVSSATRPFDQSELSTMLRRSRENNAALGVGGMLLHMGGNFMQALEGDETVVGPLYDRIAADPRHDHVKTVVRLPVQDRLFADWAMAFKEASGLPPEARAEISSFIDDSRRAAAETRETPRLHPVLRLLKSFVETMR